MPALNIDYDIPIDLTIRNMFWYFGTQSYQPQRENPLTINFNKNRLPNGSYGIVLFNTNTGEKPYSIRHYNPYEKEKPTQEYLIQEYEFIAARESESNDDYEYIYFTIQFYEIPYESGAEICDIKYSFHSMQPPNDIIDGNVTPNQLGGGSGGAMRNNR